MSLDENQRIVICALAEQVAERVYTEASALRNAQQADLLKAQVQAAVEAKLPRLLRLERLFANWWAIVGAFVAIPFATAGLATWMGKQIDRPVAERVQAEFKRDDGPVRQELKTFANFTNRLAEQLEQNVDSASAKLLRFGCNAPSAGVVDGFPACVVAAGGNSTARDAIDLHEQSIVFKANKESQRVFVRLRLSPVDSRDALRRVGLRLTSPNLLSREATGGQHVIALKRENLPPKERDFLHPGGALKLYAGVADGDDAEPLRSEIEITPLLRDGTDLHTLRLRAERLPDAPAAAAAGAERFYLHAVVVVTHRLRKE